MVLSAPTLRLLRLAADRRLPDGIEALRFTVRALDARPVVDPALWVVAGDASVPSDIVAAASFDATYRRLSDVPGSVVGVPRGVLIGLTDCGDPARIDEFHRFYDEHHALDVVRSGRYAFGIRYALDGAAATRPDPAPGFLAFYGGPGDEPATLKDYLAWPQRDKTRCDVFVVRDVFVAQRDDA